MLLKQTKKLISLTRYFKAKNKQTNVQPQAHLRINQWNICLNQVWSKPQKELIYQLSQCPTVEHRRPCGGNLCQSAWLFLVDICGYLCRSSIRLKRNSFALFPGPKMSDHACQEDGFRFPRMLCFRKITISWCLL